MPPGCSSASRCSARSSSSRSLSARPLPASDVASVRRCTSAPADAACTWKRPRPAYEHMTNSSAVRISRRMATRLGEPSGASVSRMDMCSGTRAPALVRPSTARTMSVMATGASPVATYVLRLAMTWSPSPGARHADSERRSSWKREKPSRRPAAGVADWITARSRGVAPRVIMAVASASTSGAHSDSSWKEKPPIDAPPPPPPPCSRLLASSMRSASASSTAALSLAHTDRQYRPNSRSVTSDEGLSERHFSNVPSASRAACANKVASACRRPMSGTSAPSSPQKRHCAVMAHRVALFASARCFSKATFCITERSPLPAASDSWSRRALYANSCTCSDDEPMRAACRMCDTDSRLLAR